jgi:hypothetical protein
MAKIKSCPRYRLPWDRDADNPQDGYCMCYWWPPGQFIYARKQMMFLVYWYFSGGLWPEQLGFRTGYSANHGKKSIKSCAPFEIVACYNAELEKRLETTGEVGEALAGELANGETYIELYNGKARRIYAEREYYLMLSEPARRVLNYISGRRKKMSYAKWRWQRRERKRG